ncbi:MAG: Asp-tRNA(Asn)/Glu-tRNA(Gln) amidotransferase subunit GatA [Planctomycetes bacterium]|nr:Asp-tRNA(Asn)/Glu-tRNA(Gln) amidotransferase subunit GatA [Planctomycetota bacterium]
MNPYKLTAHELVELIKKGGLKPTEAVSSVFKRIAEMDPKIKAYITLCEDSAMSAAKKLEEKIARKEHLGALAGVPFAVKDNICTSGIKTTCASRILENYVPPYDAAMVEKILAEDAIIVGKTNMDEFAMGSSCENSAFFPTRNPLDLERIPGGSSGGSAAAIAADCAVLSVGSDTGGSIRQPAALCGVVGMKPTYGLVSRYGLVAFASSLDQIGPITKDVTDTALLLKAIAGHDKRDSTSVPVTIPDYPSNLKKDIKGLRIGLPKEYFEKGVDKEISESVMKAVKALSGLGAELIDVTLPHTEYGIPAYYILAPAEASSNLARYDGVRYGYRNKEAEGLGEMYSQTRSEGFGKEVKRRIILGTFVLSSGYYDAYYLKALKVRRLIKQDFDNAFTKVDLIASPTSPIPAFKLGERTEDPLSMYMSDALTVCCNLAGLPGISIPCGFTKSKLPIGLQFIGRPFEEEKILQAAYAYEQTMAR